MTDAMCACKSPACADQVKRDFAAVVPATTAAQPPHTIALVTYARTCETTAREGDEMGQLTAMKDAMCACNDAPCVEQVEKRYADFMKREEAKYQKATPSDELMKVGEAMATC